MTLLATSILLFALSIAMRAFFALSRGALINMRKLIKKHDMLLDRA